MIFLSPNTSSLDKKFKQFKQEVHQKVPIVNVTTFSAMGHI